MQDLTTQITTTQSALLATVDQAKTALDGMADGHRQSLQALVAEAQAKFTQLDLELTRISLATDAKLRMLEAAVLQTHQASSSAQVQLQALTGTTYQSTPAATERPGFPGEPLGATSGSGPAVTGGPSGATSGPYGESG